jgi:hypothetical protein
MEGIKEEVENKIEDVVTEKLAEVAPAAVEAVAKAAEAVADKIVSWSEVKVEAKIEDLPKPVAEVVAKLEANPEVKKAMDNLVAEVDGRVITCWSCFGWDVSLRISRRIAKTSLDTPVAVPTVTIPLAPSAQPVEVLPPQVESPSSSAPPAENTTAYA